MLCLRNSPHQHLGKTIYYWYSSYMNAHHVTIEQVALSCHKWEIHK